MVDASKFVLESPGMAKSAVFQRYAQIGAATRIQELKAELEQIERAFPGISRRGPGPPPSSAGGEALARKRRKPMTAAQKKAVGIRMKAYWASRRKAKTAK